MVYIQKTMDHAEFFYLNWRLQTAYHIFYFLDIHDPRVVAVAGNKQLFWGESLLIQDCMKHLNCSFLKTFKLAAKWVDVLFSLNVVSF